MTKYGLRPGSLKGEVFGILCENGNKGITVAELSKASQVSFCLNEPSLG